MKRNHLTLAVCVAVILCSFGCGGDEGFTAPSETVEAAENGQGEPAPDFTLPNADGEQVSLSDYKGQVVLLNFWATWCGPCKIEMPWFIDFQRKYKDQGFTVLAVSMDEEGWDVVKPFVEQMELNFPVLLDDEGKLDEKYDGIMALPTTLIIDRDGNVVSRHAGLVSKSEYEKEIKALI